MKRFSLITVSVFLILLLAGCGKTESRCRLCGAPASDYPCIVELSAGNVAELKAADYGIASFSNSGDIVIRSMDTEIVTAMLPAVGKPINRSLFCDNCLAMLDKTPNNGYILVDLHDPSHVLIFNIEDGTLPDILGYSISVDTDGAAGKMRITGTKT